MSGALIALVQFGSAGSSSGGGSFAAVAYPSSFYAFKSYPPIKSAQCQAVPLGGTGPYTYVWTQVSGDPPINALTPTSPVTVFQTNTATGTLSAVFVCTITDSLSASATTNSVFVTLTSNNSGGGGTNGQNTTR